MATASPYRALVAAFATAGLLLVVLHGIQQVRTDRDLQRQRNQVSASLNTLRNRLEEGLNARIYITEALHAYTKAHPAIEQDEFADLARMLAGRRGGIRSIQLAEDTVVSHIYPTEGNETVRGLRLLELPDQRDAVLHAIRSGGTVVAGPVELVQGGVAFIARTPIFVPNPPDAERYWGLATVLIDRDHLFRQAGLHRVSQEVRLAIRGHDGEGAAGAVFYGPERVFAARPVTTTVRFPNGSWELAAVPESGWGPGRAETAEYWLFALLFTAAGSALVGLLVHRPAQLSQTNRWLKQEIEDHKRTAVALHESTDALNAQRMLQETLIDTVPVPVFMKDANGRYVACNTAFEAFLGKDRADIIGRTVHEVAPADLANRYRSADNALFRQGGQQVYEAEVQRADGRRRTVQFYKAAFRDGDGSAGGIVGTMLDVTERKENEEALREARRRAEDTVEERTRFLAAASHDLRQPLHALGLFVAQLQSATANRPDLHPLADNIRLCTDSLIGLFDTLMDISKLDAGAIAPQAEAFPVAPLLQRLAADHAPLAAEKGLALRAAPTGAFAYSDPALLERLLRNLLSNAIRYTDTGGVMIGCRREGAGLRLEVWDTGHGIPESEREAIFGEFYQGSQPTRDRQGLGLGLAIVRRLATLLGHRLDLRSRAGGGSVFAVSIPRAAAVPGPGRAEPAALPDLAQMRVLLIDDERQVREAVRGLLGQWGCRVTTADSGDAAMARVGEAAPPDVILCDYRLSATERGAEVIRGLRERGGPVPVVLITGDTSAEVRQAAEAVGSHLLFKPVQPAKLRALLLALRPHVGPEGDGELDTKT